MKRKKMREGQGFSSAQMRKIGNRLLSMNGFERVASHELRKTRVERRPMVLLPSTLQACRSGSGLRNERMKLKIGMDPDTNMIVWRFGDNISIFGHFVNFFSIYLSYLSESL